MTLHDQDNIQPRPPQTDEEKVGHTGQLSGDLRERPVREFDKTSFLEADVRGFIAMPEDASSLLEQPVETSETEVVDTSDTKVETKKKSIKNRVIAALAGVAVIAGGGAVVKSVFFSDAPVATPPVPVEPGGSDQGNQDPETNTDLSATEQLQKTISSRPEAGTAEFQTVVEQYENHAEGSSEVLSTYGHNFYGVINAALKEIPKQFYNDNFDQSLDSLVEQTNPGYWGEVYSQANFAQMSSTLSGDQLEIYNAFMVDLKLAITQRLLSADGENPTNFDDLKDESVALGIDTETQVAGTYSVTVQPNKNNVISDQNPETSQPTTINFSGIFEKSDTNGAWYWVAKA